MLAVAVKSFLLPPLRRSLFACAVSAALAGCAHYSLFPDAIEADIDTDIEAAEGWTVPEADSAIALAIARSARVPGTPSVYGLCVEPGECVSARQSTAARISHRLVELDDGVTIRVVAEGRAPAAADDGSAVPIDPAVALPQLYGEVSGLDLLGGGSLWAGRRPAVAHMPSTGDQPGGIPAMSAGIERLQFVDDLRLSYTYAEQANTTLGAVPSYHHFRVVDIPANEHGSLQLGATHIGGTRPEEGGTPRGWWVSAMHKQDDVLTGTNRFAVQRGGGGLPGPLQGAQAADSLERWRVADTLEWKLGESVSGTIGAAAQVDRSSESEARWVSVSARPVFVLDRAFQIALRIAHDRLTADAAAATRTTLMLAPTWTLDKTRGNSTIRAYYIYNHLSDPLDPVNFSAVSGDAMVTAPGASVGIRLQRQW